MPSAARYRNSLQAAPPPAAASIAAVPRPPHQQSSTHNAPLTCPITPMRKSHTNATITSVIADKAQCPKSSKGTLWLHISFFFVPLGIGFYVFVFANVWPVCNINRALIVIVVALDVGACVVETVFVFVCVGERVPMCACV